MDKSEDGVVCIIASHKSLVSDGNFENVLWIFYYFQRVMKRDVTEHYDCQFSFLMILDLFSVKEETFDEVAMF